MQDNILISVVIPMYNNALQIEKTLDSVYSQTVMPYEIVICDDGSTDDSVYLAEQYLKKKNGIICRTKVLQQQNMGAGAARNNAVKNTTGNWVAFLDADDLWMPEKLEEIILKIAEFPGIGIFSHDEYGIIENQYDNKTLNKYSSKYNCEENLFIQLFKENFFSTSCMVVRKKLIEKAGFFDESLRSAQDYDLWLRISDGEGAYIINKQLAYYITREGNISSNTYRRYMCELKIVEKYKDRICNILGEKEGRKLVRNKKKMIHLSEGYASLKNGQLKIAIKIAIRMIPQVIKY